MKTFFLLAALVACFAATAQAAAPASATITPNKLAVGATPSLMTFQVTVSAGGALAADGTITFVANKAIFTDTENPTVTVVSGATDCTATSLVSNSGQTIVFTLVEGGSCTVANDATLELTIAASIEANPAAGAVTANVQTSVDNTDVAATGYSTADANTFTTKTISSSTEAAGATATISVTLACDAALAENDVITLKFGNKYQTAGDGSSGLTLGGDDAGKFASNTWTKSGGVLALTVGSAGVSSGDIVFTFPLQNEATAQAAFTPTVEGTIAAAVDDAIAVSNMANALVIKVVSTFTTKTISSSSSVGGAANTITVALAIDEAGLAENDAITITMGANKFKTADSATLTVAGANSAVFGDKGDWVKATGVLTLTVASGQTVSKTTTTTITFALDNNDAAQAALTPAVAATIADAADNAIASSAMGVTGMDVDATTAGTVTFTPATSTITASTEVTIESANAINVCYSKDGSTDPTCNTDGTCNAGLTYNPSSKPSTAVTAVFKAVGCGNSAGGGTDATAVEATYTWTAANPTIAPAAGEVAVGSAVNLTSAGSANICYTWTGTAPTCETDGTCGSGSTTYNATAKPTVSSAKTLKAIGCAGTGKTDSAVASAAYTVPVVTTAAPATTTISGASTGAVWSAMVTVLALMGVSAML